MRVSLSSGPRDDVAAVRPGRMMLRKTVWMLRSVFVHSLPDWLFKRKVLLVRFLPFNISSTKVASEKYVKRQDEKMKIKYE